MNDKEREKFLQKLLGQNLNSNNPQYSDGETTNPGVPEFNPAPRKDFVPEPPGEIEDDGPTVVEQLQSMIRKIDLLDAKLEMILDHLLEQEKNS
jgi:hypothetical protein